MKPIKYTPDAADKLRDIKRSVTLRYGRKTAKEIIEKITNSIRGIGENENIGVSVEKMYGVKSDYRYIFTARNYVFYKVENKCIRVINIYNEKEDFMWALFGIDTMLKETIDYWEE